MTLPRWFGRKTRKKSGKKNEIQEKVCEYKSNVKQDTNICPNEYIENETDSQQSHLMRLDAFRPNPEAGNYVQVQDIYCNQLKDDQDSQLENEIHNTMYSSYSNREHGIHNCSFAEREKQNPIMSPAIYGGR